MGTFCGGSACDHFKGGTRKAYNQHFHYFATFTYSDEKHTEESFKKRLLQTLRRLATRKHWLYMGVWERGKETGRLHFHALVYIPDGEAVGSFEEVTDYNKKTGKRKTIIQKHVLCGEVRKK